MDIEDQEYHRRRAEREMDRALTAKNHSCASAHLELARIHRAKRHAIVEQRLARALPIRRLVGIDKES